MTFDTAIILSEFDGTFMTYRFYTKLQRKVVIFLLVHSLFNFEPVENSCLVSTSSNFHFYGYLQNVLQDASCKSNKTGCENTIDQKYNSNGWSPRTINGQQSEIVFSLITLKQVFKGRILCSKCEACPRMTIQLNGTARQVVLQKSIEKVEAGYWYLFHFPPMETHRVTFRFPGSCNKASTNFNIMEIELYAPTDTTFNILEDENITCTPEDCFKVRDHNYGLSDDTWIPAGNQSRLRIGIGAGIGDLLFVRTLLNRNGCHNFTVEIEFYKSTMPTDMDKLYFRRKRSHLTTREPVSDTQEPVPDSKVFSELYTHNKYENGDYPQVWLLTSLETLLFVPEYSLMDVKCTNDLYTPSFVEVEIFANRGLKPNILSTKQTTCDVEFSNHHVENSQKVSDTQPCNTTYDSDLNTSLTLNYASSQKPWILLKLNQLFTITGGKIMQKSCKNNCIKSIDLTFENGTDSYCQTVNLIVYKDEQTEEVWSHFTMKPAITNRVKLTISELERGEQASLVEIELFGYALNVITTSYLTTPIFTTSTENEPITTEMDTTVQYTTFRVPSSNSSWKAILKVTNEEFNNELKSTNSEDYKKFNNTFTKLLQSSFTDALHQLFLNVGNLRFLRGSLITMYDLNVAGDDLTSANVGNMKNSIMTQFNDSGYTIDPDSLVFEKRKNVTVPDNTEAAEGQLLAGVLGAVVTLFIVFLVIGAMFIRKWLAKRKENTADIHEIERTHTPNDQFSIPQYPNEFFHGNSYLRCNSTSGLYNRAFSSSNDALRERTRRETGGESSLTGYVPRSFDRSLQVEHYHRNMSTADEDHQFFTGDRMYRRNNIGNIGGRNRRDILRHRPGVHGRELPPLPDNRIGASSSEGSSELDDALSLHPGGMDDLGSYTDGSPTYARRIYNTELQADPYHRHPPSYTSAFSRYNKECELDSSQESNM